MTAHKKRVGRPLKAAAPGTRASLGLKVTPMIKRRLDEAATESGRTQSQEAEVRLERSFVEQDYWARLQDLLGGRATMGLAIIIAKAMHQAGTNAAGLVEISGGKANYANWPTIPYAYDQAMKAALIVLEALRPPGDASGPSLDTIKWAAGVDGKEAVSNIYKGIAAETLKEFAEANEATSDDLTNWGREVSSRLAAPSKRSKQ